MVHLSLARLDRDRADADSWARDLVQPRVDDPVLAAAECKPNATGTYWFSSVRGFGERQLLEARGVYLGGRLVLGVTSVEVCVFELVFGGHLIRDTARLRRADVRACLVPARTGRPSRRGVARRAPLRRGGPGVGRGQSRERGRERVGSPGRAVRPVRRGERSLTQLRAGSVTGSPCTRASTRASARLADGDKDWSRAGDLPHRGADALGGVVVHQATRECPGCEEAHDDDDLVETRGDRRSDFGGHRRGDAGSDRDVELPVGRCPPFPPLAHRTGRAMVARDVDDDPSVHEQMIGPAQRVRRSFVEGTDGNDCCAEDCTHALSPTPRGASGPWS